RYCPSSHNIHIYCIEYLFGACSNNVNVFKTEILDDHIEPIDTAFKWFDQYELYIRASNGKRQAWKACTGTNVGDTAPTGQELLYHCTIQDVTLPHDGNLTGSQKSPLYTCGHQVLYEAFSKLRLLSVDHFGSVDDPGRLTV